ncbi:fibrillin-1-like [Patiria miniata]|uniref:Uncharacterized protein n=1 Tax=Patiria miniata TaxID=46514 RepID=A0A913Z2W9_PATMI|nr:fibrillin-1-like [Patiria miniata]
MIAPFWADVNSRRFSQTRNVFFQVYDGSGSTMLSTLSSIVSARYSSFNAAWALVITWRFVEALSPDKSTNSFQAVLVTDYIHGYVIFNYERCGMNWNEKLLANDNVIQGFTCGNFGNKFYLDIPSDSRFRPGNIVGNTEIYGRWVQRLDSLPDNFVNPRLFCRNWSSRQVVDNFILSYRFATAHTCPCNLEVLPRYYCCQASTLCGLYYASRPPMGCWRYRTPFWFWFWGDPHIKTLDGVEYTFNGLGEYTVALVEDDNGGTIFELQGRTQRATNVETGQLTDATFYSGFAAEYPGEGRVEVKLNKRQNADDLITTVNGDVVTPTTAGLLIGNVTVKRDASTNKVVTMFPGDIQFTVGVNNSIGDITVQFGQTYMGNTKGLLGVWDGDQSNDATRRDGTIQAATGDNGEMIESDFYAFGETWRITEANSLFFYVGDETFALSNEHSFVPSFYEDLVAAATPEKLAKAQELCGDNKMCLFDTLATDDESIGQSTVMLNEMNSASESAATNYPPNITASDTLRVMVGVLFTEQLEAMDPDGDDVIFSLVEPIEGASITEDGGLFTWTPADKSKVMVGFLATDGKANATHEPTVQLCDCMNGGTCLWDEFVMGTDVVEDRFGVVLCECDPGWSGEFCEVDYDACEDGPCFMGVACFDEAPPSLNNTCGPCPEGLEGDGRFCQDIDECELYQDEPASSGGRGCDQICNNLLMDYNCSCESGYSLYIDNRRCIDIDECEMDLHNCSVNAVCNNTKGSYECDCKPGFRDDFMDGTSCTDLMECMDNSSYTCDEKAKCENTIGSYLCVCIAGYEGDGKTCQDLNECTRTLDDNCHAEADCTNTVGSYTCACGDGWTGDGTNCTNVDECAASLPVCHENAECTDTQGSFTCQCNTGYVGNGMMCADLNECTTGQDDCLAVTGDCSNTVGSFDCSCKDGYTGDGRTNCTDIDECQGNNDCSTNANCTNTVGSYQCDCVTGYTGDGQTCEGRLLSPLTFFTSFCTDINECTLGLDDCQQECSNTEGSFACNCSTGFTLRDRVCQAEMVCSDTNCTQGDCYRASNTDMCLCYPGYAINGDITVCEDIDECTSQSDPHMCGANSMCDNLEGSYECRCYPGYTLNSDQRTCSDVNECQAGTHNCDAMSQMCVNDEPYFTCDCKPGFSSESFNGSCSDVNECLNDTLNDCHIDADCLNNNGSFTCQCKDGFTGTGQLCFDIDECSLPTDDPNYANCSPFASCTNLAGSFQCNCTMGYEGGGQTCQNINECESGISACATNSTCTDNLGSYFCTCDDGFRGDGFTSCVNINECQENPGVCHSLATCTDTIGSHLCNCNQGYQGNGTYCEDVNECMTGAHECAADIAECMNNVGSYMCSCIGGYVSAGFPTGRQCDDVDECALNLDNCDTSVSLCNNTVGSYMCDCKEGYEKNELGQCEDVNECDGTPCTMANSMCANLPGTYECNCMLGFYQQESECLAAYSKEASAVFEIISGLAVDGAGFNLATGSVTYRQELKNSMEAAFGDSSLSSSFRDVVITDLTLSSDSTTALLTLVINFQSGSTHSDLEIIMALLGQLTGSNGGQLAPNHQLIKRTFIIGDPKCDATPCINSGECVEDNLATGGYTCSCPPGYSGQNCQVEPCDVNPCMNSGNCAVNSSSDTGYTCTCGQGFSGPRCETMAPCQMGNDCVNGATCINDLNTARGYTCSCDVGFMGENCEIVCKLSCVNGGTLDLAACTCTCADNWDGLNCSACTLDCMNGGNLNEATCQCTCINDWSGTTCTVCSLTADSCQEGQNLFTSTCQCSACPSTCSNNGVQDQNCECTCDSDQNWTGDYCSDCTLQCENGAQQNSQTCECPCTGNWMGTTCSDCPLTCANAGNVNIGKCQCTCAGSWTGTTCSDCPLVCQNDGTLNDETCQCQCDQNWMGITCSDCELNCMNGGTLNTATCQCSCAQSWTGTDCSDCPLSASSCSNGGEFDADFCQCLCPSDYSGPTCAAPSPCLSDTTICSDTEGKFCQPATNAAGYTCECNGFAGYFTNSDGSCTKRTSFRFGMTLNLAFRSAYRNPASAAWKQLARRIISAILNKLRGSSSTNRVVAVAVLSFRAGSVVAETALAFQGQPPSVDVISNVIAANDVLNDGVEDIALVPNSVSYINTSLLTDCTQDGCMNGGTCQRSGFSPQPTCSCPASFTGERCETEVPSTPSDLTTETPTTEGDCQLSASSCTNGGEFDANFCECLCPYNYSGPTCAAASPCSSGNPPCSESATFCQPATNAAGYTCQCNGYAGFFTNSDGSCAQRETLYFFIEIDLLFIGAYGNPSSSAWKQLATRLNAAIMSKLRGDTSTSNVIAVQVLSFKEGSVVALTAIAFQGQPPSTNVISNVIGAGNTLNDGSGNIPLVPNSVSNTAMPSNCMQGDCMNGGTCERSGFSPQLTCSCPASFTGERCETQVVTTSPPGGDVSPLATVLIIVGCVVLLLAIAGIVMCCCMLMRRQYQIKSQIYHQSGRQFQASREPFDFEDRRDRSLSSDESYSVADYREEVRRMNRLAHVMSQSPYLQSMQNRPDFIRPYMVTGNEAFERYREYEARDGGDVAGRVVYNPALYY